MTEIDKDIVFPLNIERTGVIKHITLGMVLSWNVAGDKPDEAVPLPEIQEKEGERANNLVLQDGILGFGVFPLNWQAQEIGLIEHDIFLRFEKKYQVGPFLGPLSSP